MKQHYNRTKKSYLLIGPFIFIFLPIILICDASWRFLKYSKIFIENVWHDLKINVKDAHHYNKHEFNDMAEAVILYFKVLFNRPNNVIFKDSKNKE